MTRLLVEIDDFVDAARILDSRVGDRVRTAASGLAATLDGCGGMAGDDPAGRAWAGSYDRAARAVLTATNQVVSAAYATASMFGRSALNYAAADAASTTGGGHPPTPTLPGDTCVGPLSPPPTAVGGGSDAPTGWSVVKALVGYVWPNGHQDRLRAAAAAYRRCAEVIDGVAFEPILAGVPFARDRLPEADDILTVCQGLRTRLDELAGAHRTLADACGDLADHLDDCHREVESELTSLGVESGVIQAIGGVLSIPTLGGAEVPTQGVQAARIAAVAARIGTLIARFGATVRTLAATVPEVAAVAERITATLEKLSGARLAYAGVAQVPVALRTTGRTAAQVRRTKEYLATTRLGKAAKGGLEMLSKSNGGIPGGTTKIGHLVSRLRRTRREIEAAIHAAKRAADFPGNPDMVIDEAGEIYPLGRDGIAGDSIGNIFDFLRD